MSIPLSSTRTTCLIWLTFLVLSSRLERIRHPGPAADRPLAHANAHAHVEEPVVSDSPNAANGDGTLSLKSANVRSYGTPVVVRQNPSRAGHRERHGHTLGVLQDV